LGPMTNGAPVFCRSEAFRHFLKHCEAVVAWAGGELRWRNGGAANVWPTCHTSAEQFTEQRAAGETAFGCEGGMFGSVLWRAWMGTDGGHCVRRQRGGRL